LVSSPRSEQPSTRVLPANVLFELAYAKLGPAFACCAAGALALVGAGVLTTVQPKITTSGSAR